MLKSEIPGSESENASTAALHELKEMLERDSAFAEALRGTSSTDAASKLAAEHGIALTPEALWRNRGTLVKGGLPTWRG